jgi:hypothetical protein
MARAISVVVVCLTMAVVGVVGMAFLGLMMSGDGSSGHAPVLGLYLLGGLGAAVGFGVLAARPQANAQANLVVRTVGLAVAGAVTVVVLTAISVGLGILINAR